MGLGGTYLLTTVDGEAVPAVWRSFEDDGESVDVYITEGSLTSAGQAPGGSHCPG